MKKPLIYILTIFVTFMVFSVEVNAMTRERENSYILSKVNNKCEIVVFGTFHQQGTKGGYQGHWTNLTKKNCGKYTISDKNKSAFLKTYDNNYSLNGMYCPSIFYLVHKNTIVLSAKEKKPSDNYKKSNCNEDGYKSEDHNNKGSREGKTKIDRKGTEKIDKISEIEVGEEYTRCDKMISDGMVKILDDIFLIIQLAIPAILIIMTMIDFTKAIGSSEKEDLNKAFQKFVKRAIVAMAIFLVPTLIDFLMDVTGVSDGVCGLKK